MSPDSPEVLIIGAGIAGASAAHFLAPHARVTVIEREDQPGYHSTGRSAALYAAAYGNAAVRAITRASRPFFDAPPAGFAAGPLLSPRGMLFFAREDQQALLESHACELEETGARLRRLPGAEVRRLVPALRESHSHCGFLDEASEDMDVNAIHRGFLRGIAVVRNAELRGAARAAGRWRVDTSAGVFGADVLVNAAGAWADEVAHLCGVAPIGLQPLRRTAIVFDCGRWNGAAADWPMAIDATETLYFRPEAGRFLASPADETPSPPCDAQADELDVATLLDRLGQATSFDVKRLTARWAGLRSFVEDRTLVAGFDPAQPGFFWLSGQGGYGIQTCPAMGMIAAALVLGREMPAAILDAGVDTEALSPARLHA